MATIKRVSFADIEKCHFEPEPHTVNLKTDKPKSEWWAVFDNEQIVCVCCLADRPHDKCFARVYTLPAFRNRGYCSALVKYLSEIYSEHRLVAHCLSQSINCFVASGFKLVGVRHCKHSDLYSMRKDK